MTRKSPVRRQELLAAAQQLFYTMGYRYTSINDVIQMVGVSKGGSYHYFDSKTPTATVRIILAYGDPKRLRTAQFSNWSGKAADQSSRAAQ